MSPMDKDGKICPDCNVFKIRSDYSRDKSKKDGMVTYCKPCQASRNRRHYDENSDHLKRVSRDWYAANKDRAMENASRWRASNKERLNKTKLARHHARMKSDPLYRLDHTMRASLRRLVINGGESGKLRYSAEQLKMRMECQFKEGMTWDNYGEWEIDHKIPMSRMLSRNEVRPHVVNALSNLQPMWKRDNRSKGNRFVG